jgi:catechol 2,3-dioxygenase-like lactoylglutathione lyase family enzyme
MQIHTGRLIDHCHIVVRDLDAAKTFYKAVLGVVKPEVQINEGPEFLQADELYISAGEPVSHIHLAFQALDEDVVASFYEVGLKAGGRDNGGPGERDYHPGYYGAFLYDPDGNNIEAVFHGPSTRSADAVVITATGLP